VAGSARVSLEVGASMLLRHFIILNETLSGSRKTLNGHP